ncbi:MAG TPA: DNA polymerase III subunit alpha, partial [Gammaproteobacteria bacterium]|nr:DNA polymerase III subunit alpha [Gammaproteobacteria bacterium]
IWLPYGKSPDEKALVFLSAYFPGRLWIAIENLMTGGDEQYTRKMEKLGERFNIPLCAAGDVHMHRRQQQVLQDTLTAIRLNIPLKKLGRKLYANAERYLRPRQRLQKIYPEKLLLETVNIARQCQFSLDELRYEYPEELVPEGHTPKSWLRKLVEAGAKSRWPTGETDKVRKLIEHELQLIHDLSYEPYFLTVYDITRFARSKNILCQGRGSSANSVVCFCLGITEVDPARMEMLFERFISRDRDEPPDIDVDFEHERREEVIQYIYQKYGRHRAALTATVICYRPRSAIRDVGKALGLSLEQVAQLSKSIQWWDGKKIDETRLNSMGFSAQSALIQQLLTLVDRIMGFPRHLSQHVGGFVIARDSLSRLVPIENASMPERTVIQWEKDDLEALGLLKIDVLALGMLSAIRKALHDVSRIQGKPMGLADIPSEDAKVYEMMSQADTIGVFQIESRAQMSMLPRLKPRCYYDLVIQIAIVRPGPIQGDMVHPYLKRRNGLEPVSYPSEAVKNVLSRTLGIPIFQEQVMQLAMVAAGFTAGEADQLRRCMAAWKRKGGLEPFEDKLLTGMHERGYPEDFAKQIFRQIRGFGDYGFPESHSASFALLAYASCWLKCYYPSAFTCALLNSLPMGFYGASQLVQDAAQHGVTIKPADVMHSDYYSNIVLDELTEQDIPPLRLGLHMIKGLSTAGAERVIRARKMQTFLDVQDMATRAQLNKSDLEALAASDALSEISGHRHRAYWQISGVENALPLFEQPAFQEQEVLLRRPTMADNVFADYATTGLSLKQHPMALLRDKLNRKGIKQAKGLWEMKTGKIAKVAGLVVGRQRPGTASGVVFVTLEDETGFINVIVWPKFAAAQRQALLNSKVMLVSGIVQQENNVLHLVAGRLEDCSCWLENLEAKSRDFH